MSSESHVCHRVQRVCPPAKRWLLRLFLAAASTFLCLVSLELAFNALDLGTRIEPIRPTDRRRVLDPLPGVRYLYEAHASFSQSYPSDPRMYFGDPLTVRYQLNNFGFRDDDFVLERGPELRLAFLGDSFCFGNGVHRQDTLEWRVEQLLTENRVLGREWEVYSFCLAGYNTASEAALYDLVVSRFMPDALVVWYFLNDVNVPPNVFVPWDRTQQNQIGAGLRRRSRLAEWVLSRLERITDERRLIKDIQNAHLPGAAGRQSVDDSFGRLSKRTQEDKVPVMVAIFPWLTELETKDQYPFAAAHRTVTELAKKRGFLAFDLRDSLLGARAQDLWVHPTDHHPNEVALERVSRSVFKALHRWLEQQGGEILSSAAARRSAQVKTYRDGNAAWYESFAQSAKRRQPERQEP